MASRNITSSPGFLGQWFNVLQRASLLTSSVDYDRILCKFGQQKLVMVNYMCDFNQWETGKYFEWIIILIICFYIITQVILAFWLVLAYAWCIREQMHDWRHLCKGFSHLGLKMAERFENLDTILHAIGKKISTKKYSKGIKQVREA